jgi:hypothetical protein
LVWAAYLAAFSQAKLLDWPPRYIVSDIEQTAGWLKGTSSGFGASANSEVLTQFARPQAHLNKVARQLNERPR